jgi:adenylate cyclase
VRLMQRRYDDAESAFRAALALDPGYPWAHRGLGEVYLLQGRYADAERSLVNVEMPALASGFLGFALAKLGRLEDAARLVQRLERSGHPPVWCQVAALRLGLGDTDGCLEWLERAAAHRSVGVIWVKVDPIWDPVRGDRRFVAILASMNLG